MSARLSIRCCGTRARRPVATGTRDTDSERITQVWFAGVHSNVGGGYPDDLLAHVSLTWILSEARRRGLTLKEAPGADPDAFKRVCSTQDKDGRIYDLRNGLSGYYRYGPRSVAALSDTQIFGRQARLREDRDAENP